MRRHRRRHRRCSRFVETFTAHLSCHDPLNEWHERKFKDEEDQRENADERRREEKIVKENLTGTCDGLLLIDHVELSFAQGDEEDMFGG